MGTHAIQYRGLKAILEGFDQAEISAWGLIYQKQFMGKCAGLSQEESRNELETLLRQLAKSNTTAIYTLCLYEDVKDKRKIKMSLEPDISRNVVIWDSEDNPSPSYDRGRGFYQEIRDRFDAMEAKLALVTAAPEEEDDEEDEGMSGPGAGIMGAIDKVLSNPRVQELLGEKLVAWAEGLFSSPPQTSLPMAQPAAMGSTGEGPQITQEQANKIQAAVTILVQVDDKFGDHLEKIAKIAQANPKKYHNLISMLNLL